MFYKFKIVSSWFCNPRNTCLSYTTPVWDLRYQIPRVGGNPRDISARFELSLCCSFISYCVYSTSFYHLSQIVDFCVVYQAPDALFIKVLAIAFTAFVLLWLLLSWTTCFGGLRINVLLHNFLSKKLRYVKISCWDIRAFVIDIPFSSWASIRIKKSLISSGQRAEKFFVRIYESSKSYSTKISVINVNLDPIQVILKKVKISHVKFIHTIYIHA